MKTPSLPHHIKIDDEPESREHFVLRYNPPRTARNYIKLVLDESLFLFIGLALAMMLMLIMLCCCVAQTVDFLLRGVCMGAVFTGILSIGVAATFGIFKVYWLQLPSHIRLQPDGLKFLWRQPGSSTSSWLVPCEKLHSARFIKRPFFGGTIEIVVDTKRLSREEKSHILWMGHSRDPLRILLHFEAISDPLDRLRLHNYLDRVLGDRYETSLRNVIHPLLAPSYTKLWLDGFHKRVCGTSFEELKIGSTVANRFCIDRVLGMGGQGRAYLALENSTKKEVVLKEFILPSMLSREAAIRLSDNIINQSRLLLNLNFDCIAKLFDVVLDEHRIFVVLEHVKGMSLRRMVSDSGPVDADVVLQLGLKMCAILDYLHKQSPPVVHRDFTPDNLILDGEKLCLIDFDIAVTSEQSIFDAAGRQSYIALEQFQGKAVPQSDIYSLGASLYFLATGHDPEPFSQSDVMLSRSDWPSPLARVIGQCTAVNLAERYATTGEIARDLAAVKETRVITQ